MHELTWENHRVSEGYGETNVFKRESVRRGIFMSVRRGVSLEALRSKPFVI